MIVHGWSAAQEIEMGGGSVAIAAAKDAIARSMLVRLGTFCDHASDSAFQTSILGGRCP